jgi:type I phosphodiesterase/nucleotide pyrophosphatase
VRRRIPPILIVFSLLGGLVALLITWAGSVVTGIVAGLGVWLICLGAIVYGVRHEGGEPDDPGRRRFLALAGLGGLAWVAGGTAIARVGQAITRPDPRVVQHEMAGNLGAEYMELVRHTYKQGRSGDLQLLLAPFNSSNYPQESVSLVPRDPRTSHASVWMYLERVPLLVYAPGIVEPSDSEDRVTLADLAPTTAHLIGYDGYPGDRDGRVLPGLRTSGVTPKVVVTFVIDGGGWNVLDHWNQAWPNLQRLMQGGANYRNAITGSFPAVTACAHATIGTGAFPWKHGITGHNIRDGTEVRKAYRSPGQADPSDILVPTLADLWSDETGNAAWVGQIGYQVWHLGMLGHGGTNRPAGDKPVGVFWDEDGSRRWQPHNPDLFRLPAVTPGPESLAAHQAAFTSPGWDPQFTPQGRQAVCCSPPIIQHQGDLIEATIESEPMGTSGTSDLLYINYKSPDYTGHIYNFLSKWEELVLKEVDAQLQRLVDQLERRFPGEYVLIVTADHGQCPLPDTVDGVRLDPIQLGDRLESRFGGLYDVVQSVVPSEVYLYTDKLWDAGVTLDDVAASLRDLTYRENIGPYVPVSAIEQTMLDHPEFAAVFATSFLDTLNEAAVSGLGATAYTGPDVDPGIPHHR